MPNEHFSKRNEVKQSGFSDAEQLRRAVRIGIDHLNRGEGELHDMESIQEEVQRRLKASP